MYLAKEVLSVMLTNAIIHEGNDFMKYRILILLLLLCLVGCNTYDIHDEADISGSSSNAPEAYADNEQEPNVPDTYDPIDSITEPTEVTFDHVEMTNGTGTIPREIVKVGDTFMGMEVAHIRNRDVLFPVCWGGEFDGWAREVNVQLKGELALPGRIVYDRDCDYRIRNLAWFWLDVEALEMIPMPAYDLYFGRAFRVGNFSEVIERLDDESVDVEGVLTISSISLYYLRFTQAIQSRVMAESFEAVEAIPAEEQQDDNEPEPLPATQVDPANQIIFAHIWSPGERDWLRRVTITDPEDVALIKDFLRDAQPVQLPSHRFNIVERHGLSGIIETRPWYISLVLDGEPMRFYVTTFNATHYPYTTSERLEFFRYGSPRDIVHTVDWRIWRVLRRYQPSGFQSNVARIAPRRRIIHPHEDVFSLGQVFEQNGVALDDVLWIEANLFDRDIWPSATSGHSGSRTILNAADIADLWEALTQVQLTPQDAPPGLGGLVLRIDILTADFRVVFEFNAAAMRLYPLRENHRGTQPLAFYGESGAQLYAALVAVLHWRW